MRRRLLVLLQKLRESFTQEQQAALAEAEALGEARRPQVRAARIETRGRGAAAARCAAARRAAWMLAPAPFGRALEPLSNPRFNPAAAPLQLEKEDEAIAVEEELRRQEEEERLRLAAEAEAAKAAGAEQAETEAAGEQAAAAAEQQDGARRR